MRALRIAYCGNFKPAASTESHVAASLESLGHIVDRIQEDEVSWPDRVTRAKEHASDLFVWTCTWHDNQAAGHEALTALREAGITSISYHLDLYLELARQATMSRDPFWATDMVFTADGGHQNEFEKRGINHQWIRPGVYGPECVTGQHRPEWDADVAFIGSYSNYHREWPYRRRLVNWLQATYGDRYRHFGGGLGPSVRGQDLNDALASAKVIVGDSLCLNFTHKRYWSDRVYETLGRGGFLIHPWIEGLEEEFTDGKHLAFYRYNDFDQLKELIDYYISHDDEREQIRQEGQRFVRENCTYAHRCQQMLGIYAASEQGLTAARESIEIRESDQDVIDEIFTENVYRIRPEYLQGATVLDIGANIGAFSVFAAHLGADRVIAVEPEMENYALLQRNTVMTPEIQTMRAACTRESSSVQVLGEGGGAWTIPGADTPAYSLDDLFSELGLERCDFLKLDVEGAEYEIVAGATVLDRVGRIAIEFHGPRMLDGREHAGSFGQMVAALSEHFALEIIGRPSIGGMIYGHAQ
jgi:FkbM family methyltransferase